MIRNVYKVLCSVKVQLLIYLLVHVCTFKRVNLVILQLTFVIFVKSLSGDI